MQSVSSALNALQRECSWFVRATEHRALSAVVGGDLRAAALQVFQSMESHADNRAAWVLVEDAWLAADPGWLLRTNRVRAHWERLVEAFAKEGITVAPLTPSTQPNDNTAAGFATTLGEALARLPSVMTGLVVVLAPTVVDDVTAFGTTLVPLVTRPGLERVRWVVAVDETHPGVPVLEAEPALRTLRVRCVVDPAALDADLDVIVSPTGGMAAPKGVTPPPRVDDPPPLAPEVRDAALAGAGVDPKALAALPVLRGKFLGAAVAMKRGNGNVAVQLQREGCEAAAGAGLVVVALIGMVTLASYMSGLGDRVGALTVLTTASTEAEARMLPLQQAQAELARGMLLALDARYPEAAVAYARAGEAGERAAATSIAMEAWRLCGTLQLQQGDEGAVRSLQRAIDLAETSSPDTVKTSSAPEAARQLAEVYARRNIDSAAASLHALADAMERGDIGAVPPAEVAS